MGRMLSAIKSWFVPSGKQLLTIKFGVFKGLKMNLDLRSQTQVWLGLWEREVYPHLLAFTRRAKTGIDVGSADGVYSLFFLSQPNINRVLAFDPSDSFPASLSAGLAINGFGDDKRAMLIKKYVAAHEDHDHCTLDSLALELEGPCVVKIDVDGGEGVVLQGANKLMHRHDVSWIIETHSVELEQECVQILASNGLTTKIIKNAWWRFFVPEGRPIPHNRWLVAWHDKNAATVRTVERVAAV